MKAISFGEVLFDVFPDGAHLGGAPLNLAVHLRRLGAEAALISAVGNDELGERALKEIAREGVDFSRVAKLGRPTGRVTVTLDDAKVPSYDFLADCAYDTIPYPESLPEADLFCYGTLAQRGEVSRRTLHRLLEKVSCRKFYDVNLRQSFYTPEILDFSLHSADIVKLNEEELPRVAELLDLAPCCRSLAEHYSLELVILTLGADGCDIYRAGECIHSPAFPVKVVSTVGAGDSFSAAFLYSYLNGATIKEAAEAGNRLAARIAGQPGAF